MDSPFIDMVYSPHANVTNKDIIEKIKSKSEIYWIPVSELCANGDIDNCQDCLGQDGCSWCDGQCYLNPTSRMTCSSTCPSQISQNKKLNR